MIEGATLTLNVGDKYPRNALVEGNYLYVSLWDWGGGIAKVVKIDLTTFTLVSTLAVSALDGRTSGMVVSGNFLYVVVADDPGIIVKVDLTTFSVADSLTVPGWPQQSMHVAADATFLYATSYQGGDNLFKISLATFAIVDTLAIAQGGGAKHPLIYDGFLYIPSGDFITKVNLTTFAVDSILDLLVGSHDSAALVRLDNHLYHTDNGNPALMSKVDLTTFTKVGELVMSFPDPRDLVIVGSHLYTCHYFANRIIQTDPSTLTEIDSLTLSAAADSIRCMAHDSLYVGSRTSPGRVTKVAVVLAPTVSTNPATDILQKHTSLPGTLDDDGGEACDCGFEWGATIAYGNTSPTQSRTTGQTFSQLISGLSPNATYHFRAFATNSVGTGYGADRTFTTQEMLLINKAYALAREEL